MDAYHKQWAAKDDGNVSRSLTYSFYDGVCAAGMVGFTQDYFTPFLLLLGGTAKEVALLAALPNLFAAITQLKSADITEWIRSRKRVITCFVFLQAFMLLPMMLLAVSRSSAGYVTSAFIGMAMLFTASSAIATPAWASLMTDLVLAEKRGDYFGWRMRVLGFVQVGMAYIAGLLLHWFDGYNLYYGFALVFGLASFFRFTSWYNLRQMYEPPREFAEKHYYSFVSFIHSILHDNVGRFVLFVSLLTFSVNLAGPFFAVLMLRDLRFGYLKYTIITVTAQLAMNLVSRRWGWHADRVGNLKVMKLTSRIVAILPLLWVINLNPVYLIVVQVISGFSWVGFSLCSTNFLYDAVGPERRPRAVAYFNVLNGSAISIGAILGGLLLQALPPLFGHKILSLFVVSFICRAIVAIWGPGLLREVRPVERVSSNALFYSMVGIKPMFGVQNRTVRY